MSNRTSQKHAKMLAMQIALNQSKHRPMSLSDIQKLYAETLEWAEQQLGDECAELLAALDGSPVSTPADAHEPVITLPEPTETSPETPKVSELVTIGSATYDITYMPDKTKKAMFENEDTIMCLECKQRVQMLTKLHLKRHGLTVKEYKEKYGIPGRMKLSSAFHINRHQKSRDWKQRVTRPKAAHLIFEPTPRADGDEIIMRVRGDTFDISYMPEETRDAMFGDKDTILCLVCRERMRVITKPHLQRHGMTKEEYKNKFGIPHKMKLSALNVRSAKDDEDEVDDTTYVSTMKGADAASLKLAGAPPEELKEVLSPIVYNSLFSDLYRIKCLECGRLLEVLSLQHAQKHGLTVEEYKAKYGIPNEVSLTSQYLLDERITSMKSTYGPPSPRPTEPSREELENILAPEVYDSLFADRSFITCLECKKKYSFLSRAHLDNHNIAVEKYKEKWGIPSDVKLVSALTREVRSRAGKKF